MNAQIVCDMDRRIIALDAGHPGSASDSTVFKGMDQYLVPEDYFSPGEYLLADAAYAVSKTCIPPYKAPSSELPDNSAFNFHLACSRVRNEHCIGILKGRWQSMKELRHRLRTADNMENLCFWVISCCVLHNVLLQTGDKWTKEDGGISREDHDMESLVTDREAT